MQILVVVASIQVRTLKAEVEKGSMGTVIDHGLVDPKGWVNSLSSGFLLSLPPKGHPVNIPEPEPGYWAVTQLKVQTPAGSRGRVFFSC